MGEIRFKVGDVVEKILGYRFPGVVVATFSKRDGQERYVVECTATGAEGMLHIFRPDQLAVTRV